MKHVVISREGGDFSMDLIFAGLVRRFGVENVIDYPPRDKHRQGRPELVGDHERDYGAERRSLCYVDGCESMPKSTSQEVLDWTDSHRCADLGREQATIWLDETNESMAHWLWLCGMSSKRPRTVVIAGHDNFRGDPRIVLDRFRMASVTMFIDDWQTDYNDLPNTHLINLSCNFDHLWDVENRYKYLEDKKYDICFIGYNSNPIRKVVIDHVKQKWGYLNNCIIFEERPNQFDKFVRHDEMFRLMAQSKICLNLPGASTNGRALRYYEIPYVGSFMLSQKAPVVYLEPKMGQEFNSLDQFDQSIEFFLGHDDDREFWACIDHTYCMKHHTIDARMDYIFGVLDGQARVV